jgi:hypothetical protein
LRGLALGYLGVGAFALISGAAKGIVVFAFTGAFLLLGWYSAVRDANLSIDANEGALASRRTEPEGPDDILICVVPGEDAVEKLEHAIQGVLLGSELADGPYPGWSYVLAEEIVKELREQGFYK